MNQKQNNYPKCDFFSIVSVNQICHLFGKTVSWHFSVSKNFIKCNLFQDIF